MTTTHTTHTSHAKESAHRAAEPAAPALDIEKLLQRLRLPGVDVPALVEAQKKNLQALREANQKAYDGALALAKRQTEIFEETIREWQDVAKDLAAKAPAEAAASRQAELAKKAVEKALANMRELAEMAVQSQADAFQIIGRRVRASIEELREYTHRKT